MEPRASAVLLNYERPQNLPGILDCLLALPFVDDIVVWDNSPGQDLEWLPDYGERVKIGTAGKNLYTYARFLATRYARHDTIITQDDDYLLGNWPEIWEGAARHPGVITAALDERHRRYHDPRHRWGTAHEVLLGWGSVFDRRWIAPAFAPWIDRWGEDYLLHRKADRIFSLMLNREHHTIPAEETLLDGVRSPNTALFRRPDHVPLNHDARKRALELLGIDTRLLDSMGAT